jgi:hypothetical protein
MNIRVSETSRRRRTLVPPPVPAKRRPAQANFPAATPASRRPAQANFRPPRRRRAGPPTLTSGRLALQGRAPGHVFPGSDLGAHPIQVTGHGIYGVAPEREAQRRVVGG